MSMSDKILIVKNIPREGPGLLEILLQEKSIAHEIIDLDRGGIFPSPRHFAALVVLGGPDSANDPTPKMKGELHRIREALDLDIPYLGVCLGMQALAKAAGGEVVKSPVQETGFRDAHGNLFSVNLTLEGAGDPLFANLPDTFNVFQLHGETVRWTTGVALLGTGKHCINQIIKVGANAYGLQCHFELTPEMFECWLREDPCLRCLKREDLRRDFEGLRAQYTSTGRRLLENFLALAGLMPEKLSPTF